MPYFGAPNVNGNPAIGPDNALDPNHYINGYMGPNHGVYGGSLPSSVTPEEESWLKDHDFAADSLSQLRSLAQDHPEYMELYLQLLAERENTTSAQKWYEDMSNSSYQRAYKDLEKAGINPYFALQALGGAGSGSVNPSGTWSTSPYGNKVSMESAKASKESADASMIRALAGVSTAILGLLVMMI